MAPPDSALDFLEFVNASPSPYHAVQSIISRLEKAGFVSLRERDSWDSTIKPGDKYYTTRNASTIVAFTVGSNWRPGNPIAMIGAHTDSPCLRVKPISKSENVGYLQVRVETYGRGLWHSWFDRDLSIAGRALVRDGATGNFVQKVVQISRPVVRIPFLTVHLNHSAEFTPNIETELLPITGLVEAELSRTSEQRQNSQDSAGKERKGITQPMQRMTERHHPYIVELIAKEAGVEADDVVDFEMILYDTQKACIGGMNEEFIHSARLDNLEMTYCSITALLDSVKSKGLGEDSSIRMVACFDHEEIGSTSAQGANSDLMPSVIRRLSAVNVGDESVDPGSAFERTMASSFLISADMAHCVHPNYTGKYEDNHHPEMNKGVVIKVNACQKYATNSLGIVLLQEVARQADVPLQLFVVRNDSTCGTTIGPLMAAKLGMRTLDLGNPQLSMHSIRETSGVKDIPLAVDLLRCFLSDYVDLEVRMLNV